MFSFIGLLVSALALSAPSDNGNVDSAEVLEKIHVEAGCNRAACYPEGFEIRTSEGRFEVDKKTFEGLDVEDRVLIVEGEVTGSWKK